MLTPYLKLSRSVHLLCAGALLNRAGAFVIPFLTIYLQKELDLGEQFATTAIGGFGLGTLIASLAGGHLADQWGRRATMALSLFGSAAVLAAMSLMSTGRSILPAVILFGVVAEMYRPAAAAMIADLTEPQQRPHAFSLMYVAINLGFALAASVGGILSQFSFQYLFWGDAITAAAFAMLILLALPETLPSRRPDQAADPHDGQNHQPDSSEPLAPAPAATAPPGRPLRLPGFHAIRPVVTDGLFVTYCGSSFLLMLMFMQAFSTFPLYLKRLGFDADVYGRIIAVNGILIVLLQIPTTGLVSRFNRGWMIVASAVVTGIGFGLHGVAASAWAFAVAVVVWTFGEMMNAPLMSAIISDLAPVDLRARYMGVYSMSFSLALLLGAPAGGWILVHFGGGALWTLCGFLAALSAVGYALATNHPRVAAAAATTTPPP